MANILIDLHYLPTIEYFCEFIQAETIAIESQETFQKQTFRNRTKILTANKVMNLNVPVIKGRSHVPIQEVKIDYSQNWLSQHKRAVVSAYGKAPFFEHYWVYIEMILNKKVASLFTLNKELLTVCLKLLQINKPISFTEDYHKTVEDTQIDLRSIYSPKNKEMPKWQYYYYQLFGNNFAQSLSIIDLLFCTGPEARQILLQAVRTKKI